MSDVAATVPRQQLDWVIYCSVCLLRLAWIARRHTGGKEAIHLALNTFGFAIGSICIRPLHDDTSTVIVTRSRLRADDMWTHSGGPSAQC